MHGTAKSLWTACGALALILAGVSAAPAESASTVNLPQAAEGYTYIDDDVPDVTARVARISFIRGEVQIRRAGIDEWERATLNLPVVEGDEITTGDGRIEIQFDIHTHLRLGENSYLKIATLKDDGIAISLPSGTISFRITSFDKDKAFFEADAPKTTLAVQRAGTYRINSGKDGEQEIRVSVYDGGEARIYSDNAGFTLKNGRSARVFIDGPNSGEWESKDVSSSTDEFDEWVRDRDELIAKRMSDAYYDRYYDRDIYGADDLNGYGEWVRSADYGYVWRPFNSSISVYADWSPYRYGHWRWIPPYGWVWVNDEPWGWATYHHGRWIYDNGYWVWSPYGYYRSSRSWWFPALVVINIYNNNYCWYPLPYRHRYRHRDSHHGGHHNTGGIKPIPTNTPFNPNSYPTGGVKPIPPVKTVTGGIKPPKIDKVPPSGVVSVGVDEFGTTVKAFKKASPSMAAAVLSKDPGKGTAQLPVRKVSRHLIVDMPSVAIRVDPNRVGATERKGSAPLDNELRTKRVFGDRVPVVSNDERGGGVTTTETRQPRRTGAVERSPVIGQTDSPPTKRGPIYSPPPVSTDPPPVRVPRRSPSPVQVDSSPTRQPPRTDPPVRVRERDPSPVRAEPPPIRQPKSEPSPTRQPRSDPPPVKSEPKPGNKPTKSRDAVAN